MKSFGLFVSIFVLLLSVTSVAEEECPRMQALRCTPKIDGKIGDKCWGKVNQVSDFVNYTENTPSVEGTRAWVGYDDDNLYIAFECMHEATAELKRDATDFDGNTWLDDSIEIFLDPWNEQEGYYQLAINCLGVIRDSVGSDVRWDSGAKAKARRNETNWTLEVAIPYDALDVPFATPEVWGINFVRNDRVNGETVVWSFGGIHKPSRFGSASLKPNLLRIHIGAMREKLGSLETERASIQERMAEANLKASEIEAELDSIGKDIGLLAKQLRQPKQIDEEVFRGLTDRYVSLQGRLNQAWKDAYTAPFSTGDVSDGKGFHVVVASSLEKVFREDELSATKILTSVDLRAAKDEVESFQLVIVPTRSDLKDVEIEVTPLRGQGGEVPIEWQYVDYVETAPPRGYYPEKVGWWPDILMPPTPFDVAEGVQQPIWFRVTVPPDAVAGEYQGEVVIRHAGHSVTVPVQLEVWDFQLPRPGSLACPFGIYPGLISEFYFGPGSYQELMPIEGYAKWCEYLAKYRLTPKNVGNDYLKTVGDPAKGGSYDVSNLNITVKPYAKDFPPYSFTLYRLPCPDDVREGVTKRDPEVWIRHLEARQKAYQALDLPKEVYIYGIDEPHEKAYDFVGGVYERVKEVAPGYPIMQTVNRNIPKQLADLVDIWCPLSARLEEGLDFYKERQREGDQLWLYVCCSPKPPYANFFVDQPAIDHRTLFWQTYQKGATGVLLWCVCYWRGLPGPASGGAHFPEVKVRFGENMDSYVTWGGNGDGTLIWPGPDMTPYPSIRLEVVRDGIEDYEYLALLNRCLKKVKDLPEKERPSKELLKRAEELSQVGDDISRTFIEYNKDPEVLFQRRKAIGGAVEELVGALGQEPAPEWPEYSK